MANTVLGPSTGQTMTVHNSSTTAIPSARAVSYDGTTSLVLLGPDEIGIVGVSVSAANDKESFVGITVEQIDPGDTGVVIYDGMALCEASGTIIVRGGIKITTAGLVIPNGGTEVTSIGTAMEVKRADPTVIDTDLGGGVRDVAYCLIKAGLPHIDATSATLTTEVAPYGGVI